MKITQNPLLSNLTKNCNDNNQQQQGLQQGEHHTKTILWGCCRKYRYLEMLKVVNWFQNSFLRRLLSARVVGHYEKLQEILFSYYIEIFLQSTMA